MSWLERIASNDLPYTAIDASGRRFETGIPVEFKYVRNNQKAPNYGSKFQQDIEPAGRYLIHNEEPGPEDYLEELKRRGWEFGTHKFENPLVMAFNTNNEAFYDENSWKATLSRKFGGFKGAALSKVIAGKGYDGIVTVRLNDHGQPLYVSEIVDLRKFHESDSNSKPMPLPVDVPREERDHMGVDRMDDRMTQETANQLRQQYPAIEYGGAGQIGIAFRTGPGEIMKVTHDLSEANAAKYVFENPMDWVVEILEEPQMIQENPPMWSIRMQELQPIEDFELSIFIGDLVRMDEGNRFPGAEQIGSMIEEEFRRSPEKMDAAMDIYAHVKYILNMNNKTLWLTDIHGGNVGWGDDGNLKVFDLGPGNFIDNFGRNLD